MATSSIPDRWKYDIFVSFRGEDIRKSFMDHLFKDFKQKGIQAFRDDKELPKGEVISPELHRAIEQSRFLIVIFSKSYASSSWCLRELVKILECKEVGKPKSKQEVRIIFYDVKPDVVRKQTESYAEAFAKHQVLNRTEVAKWKDALSKAADLCGWDLEDLANGYEAKFIDNISSEILKKLCDGPLHVGENIVGVDAHLKKLNLVRFVGSNKVHMIGICGISGIGKTTLAKAIYNLMYTHFEGSCFCDDIHGVSKRQGLTQVQMQLIHDINKTSVVNISNVSQGVTVMKRMMSSKSILLVLDDVEHREQLEALAGSSNWFSDGSLIIFTCKDKQLLKSHRVDEIYDMGFLDKDESLELFSSYAFHEKHLTKGFEKLANEVVKYVQGHPLALKILGSFLYGKSVGEWGSELDSLKLYPNNEIQRVLRLSYDGLNFCQQKILLDIAFAFIGMKRDLVASVLDSCDLHAHTNMRVLVDKSLITISPYDMSLQMHQLIQGMAREIVREESIWPGKRSRLWIPLEVYHVLSENEATEVVEVIDLLEQKSSQKFDIKSTTFTCMKNLRILKLPNDPNVNFYGMLECLSNKLRYLHWHGCPFMFLPLDFYPKNIVSIDLSYSRIKNLWTTPKCFTRLKIMKLSHCHNLTNTPDFTEITNLEELILEGCVSLVKFHPSIGMLKRLVVLNVSGCLKVDHLPQALGKIKTLLELHIDQTAITRLPSFVFSLTNLLERFWSKPSRLPQSLVLSLVAGLPLLRELYLSDCNIMQVPENIGSLSCLTDLYLNGNSFTSLPISLSQLARLEVLRLDGCKKLKVFPELPLSIEYLDASECNTLQVIDNIGALSCLEYLRLNRNNFSSLPGSLSQLSHLWKLEIDGCKNLEVFPKLPPSIVSLFASDCNILQVPENIGSLSYLKELYLNGNGFTSLPRSLSQLSHLTELGLRCCKKLEVFPNLPPSIEYLDASDCNILQVPENIGSLSCLKYLCLSRNKFTSLPGTLRQLSSLWRLEMDGCKKLEVLPTLPPSIEYLYASNCSILQVQENIGALSCLKELYFQRNNFTSLPGSLSHLSRLSWFKIDGCKKLEVLPELPLNIRILDASNCTSLREVINLDCRRVSCNFLNCPNLLEIDSSCKFSSSLNFQETESDSDA